MYENSVCSLCVAVNHKNTGNPFLFRIADVEDGKIKPFIRDDSAEYEHANIDLIYNPKVPVEGSIGFWDWYSEEARRQRSFLNNICRWTEYVILEDVSNVNEALEKLCSGVEGVSSDHDYLFEYECCDDETAYCLFVRGVDFQRSINSSTVSNDVAYLNVYRIAKEDVHDIKTWHLPNFHRQYHGCMELGEVVRKEYIRSIDSTIKKLIQSRITIYVPSNKKSDKAAVRNFLNLVPESPLINMLAQSLGCEENEAQTYVDRFLATCQTYFSCEDYDAQIMQRLIAHDTEIAERFRNQVKSEWEQQNRGLLEEANKQLIDIQDKMVALQTRVVELDQAKTAKEKDVNELELYYKNMQQTAYDIELGIRQKIDAATHDIANFFSEYALFMPNQQIVDSHAQATVICQPLSDSPEIINELNVLWDCLQDNLIASGVERDRGKSLAAYLLAAYFSKVPLIVAGYGAELILRAVSATLTNMSMFPIYDIKVVNAQTLAQLPNGSLVAVHSAFDMVSVNKIVSENPFLYVALISTTAEELSIEPRGIYNYALPLFAEYYVTAEKKDEVNGSISRVDFKPQQNSIKKTSMPNHVLPAYAKRQSDRLASIATQIYPDITIFDLFMIQVIPIMLSIEGREETVEFIMSSKLSDNEKKKLLRLIGERDE